MSVSFNLVHYNTCSKYMLSASTRALGHIHTLDSLMARSALYDTFAGNIAIYCTDVTASLSFHCKTILSSDV